MQEYIDAELRKHKFTIKTKVFGKDVEGEFECKYPSVLDSLKIQTEASKYLEGADPQNTFDNTVVQALKIATNDRLLTKRPKWYNIENLDDFAVVDEVYKEVEKFIESFRQKMYEGEDSRNSTEADNAKAMEGEQAI